MTEDIDSRRRRAAYRAQHRGTKEMDWMLGRFAERVLQDMSPEALEKFEQLLAMPDPELHQMILHPELAPAQEAFVELIGQLRTFNGLGR